MKTINLKIAIAILFSIVVAFASCKKDNPILEDDQEEYDGIKLTFTNLSDPKDILTINFDKEGNSEKSHYHLLKNERYKMEITLFHNGKNINHEFIEEIDEHKFFFLAPEDAITNYLYQDNDLGLKGEITFGSYDSAFDLIALLRHGLDKNHPSAKAWNSIDYQKAGGVDDLRLKIPLHLIIEGHDHE
jgi:hypothetical protein